MNQPDAGSYAFAFALSNAVGIRPFLTLAITAQMMWSGSVNPDPHFAWLGHGGVAILIWLLAALEFFADKIPFVDHVFHVFHFATKPIVAALVAGGTIHFDSQSAMDYATQGAFMFAAAANAMGLHVLAVTARGVTTSFTFGTVNPVVSVLEDILCVLAIVVAVLAPLLGVGIGIATMLFAFAVLRLCLRKMRQTRARIAALRREFPGPAYVFVAHIVIAKLTGRGRKRIRTALGAAAPLRG